MTMKERDYEGYKQFVCSKCGYDTFDPKLAKEHDEGEAHNGPTSEVQK